AYIYAITLVDPWVRAEYGVHSTPHTVARYIVHRLPLDAVLMNARPIVEPCSGHSIFLVAALRRLRDLMEGTASDAERHRLFVRVRIGFERDPFVIEVGRLCLLLADSPNRHGLN